LGYLATAIGIILTSFALLDLKPQLKIYAPLREMGKASLGMYILHLLIIRFFLEIFWPAQPFINFATIYFVLMVFLVGCAYGLRLIRKTWPKRPHAIKSFIG
jgi:peptidoglycan/LPS O-acetylase OafA/YrhL